MEGAKRKIHRLRNSLSRRLSSTEVIGPEPKTDGNVNVNTDANTLDDISKEHSHTPSPSETKTQSHPAMPTSAASGGIRGTIIPKSFTSKKTRILAELAVPEGEYSDKSPKGSVDEGVKEMIELVNAVEGWVTTSSCAGRVSVFVEGMKGDIVKEVEGEVEGEGDGGLDAGDGEGEVVMNGVDRADVRDVDDKDEEEHERERGRKKIRTGPGGKGGGRWLYVSHDPIPNPPSTDEPDHYTKLFGLEPMSTSSPTPFHSSLQGKPPRLIHLSFSPLILHTLCAALPHARPLLAAAINAGFRESGVQSLKALDDDDAGVMLGIRTTGLVFSTVIGMVLEGDDGKESMQAMVGEEYLKMCVDIVNERFQGNERRKERLLNELGRAREELQGKDRGAESKEERRERKREEGLRRQEEVKENEKEEQDVNGVVDDDQLEDGLRGLENR
jgi:tRNA wybutosine-synthesizing protein 3